MNVGISWNLLSLKIKFSLSEVPETKNRGSAQLVEWMKAGRENVSKVRSFMQNWVSCFMELANYEVTLGERGGLRRDIRWITEA